MTRAPLLLAALLLAGCTPDAQATKISTPQTILRTQQGQWGQPVHVDQAEQGAGDLTVSAPTTRAVIDDTRPTKGAWITFTVTASNPAGAAMMWQPAPGWFKLRSADGRTDYHWVAVTVGRDFDNSNLAPGEQAQGTITFDGPRNLTGLVLTYRAEDRDAARWTL